MKKVVNNINKKYFMIGGAAVVAIAVIVLIIILIVNNTGNKQEKSLNKYLKQLGNAYYEKYYGLFDDETARSNFLAKYSTLGIKVDLENLARTVADSNGFPSKDEIMKKFVNNKTKQACNSAKTKLTFYPQKPYGKKDYKMEINLDCGFDK